MVNANELVETFDKIQLSRYRQEFLYQELGQVHIFS
jgi:hypothetical protein